MSENDINTITRNRLAQLIEHYNAGNEVSEAMRMELQQRIKEDGIELELINEVVDFLSDIYINEENYQKAYSILNSISNKKVHNYFSILKQLYVRIQGFKNGKPIQWENAVDSYESIIRDTGFVNKNNKEIMTRNVSLERKSVLERLIELIEQGKKELEISFSGPIDGVTAGTQNVIKSCQEIDDIIRAEEALLADTGMSWIDRLDSLLKLIGLKYEKISIINEKINSLQEEVRKLEEMQHKRAEVLKKFDGDNALESIIKRKKEEITRWDSEKTGIESTISENTQEFNDICERS